MSGASTSTPMVGNNAVLIRIYAEFQEEEREAPQEPPVFISPEEEELQVADTKIRGLYEQSKALEDEDDLPGCERRRFVLGSVAEGEAPSTTFHLREDWHLPHIAGRVWQCAVYFSQWVQRHGAAVLGGAHVVELGAGAGLPGLVASLYAPHTLLTDYGEALRNLAFNADHNKARLGLEGLGAVELDWTALEGGGVEQRSADVVLATEVVYSDATCELFFRALQWTLKPGGVCYLAQDITRYGVPELMKAFEEAGLEVLVQGVPEWIQASKELQPDEDRAEYFLDYRFCSVYYKDHPTQFPLIFDDVAKH